MIHSVRKTLTTFTAIPSYTKIFKKYGQTFFLYKYLASSLK